MKTLKVYNDTHLGVKVQAAKSGRTTTDVASILIDRGLKDIEVGAFSLIDDDSKPESETEEVTK